MSLTWILIILAAFLLMGLIALGLSWFLLLKYRNWELDLLVEDASHFPNEKSKFADIDEIKLHYTVEGTGPDIILLHGIAANIFCWRKLIPLLAPHFRVWAIDLMGFGISDKPTHLKYDVYTQAQMIEKFMEKMGIQKAVLLGNSMGASIATQVALDKPQTVSHLILTCASANPHFRNLKLTALKKLSKNVRPIVNRFTVSQILKAIYGPGTKFTTVDIDAYLKPYGKDLQGFESFTASFDILIDQDLWDRASRNLKVPVLILWGQHDRLVQPKYAEMLKERIPNSQLFIHPDAGHHIHEEVPEWMTTKLADFTHS